MHTPVLLQSVIDSINSHEGLKYIDATFGEGGYTRAILQKGGMVFAMDIDENQIKKAEISFQKEIQEKKLFPCIGNFSRIEELSKKNNFKSVDGIVFDLGLSMEQLRNKGIGLSYKALHEPLDMRLDPNLEYTAEFYLNTMSSNDLYDLFARNSEEIKSREIAESIVKLRVYKRIRQVKDLVIVLDKIIGKRNFGIYARIFQALRIQVNHEFENLQKGLSGALKIISDTGRIVVVTFHSLEDRIVKKFIKSNYLHEISHVLRGSGQRSFEKSAKLRVFSKNTK